jgi:hypothetical protein
MSVFGRESETGDAGASLLDRLSDRWGKKDLTAPCDASRVDVVDSDQRYGYGE